MSIAQTFTVTVVSTGGGNKYFIDGVQQDTVMIGAGLTYRFDQSDSSNGTGGGHPLRFSTNDNNSPSAPYTTGVTVVGTPGSSGAYTEIAVENGAPSTLYYYCSNHSGMGGQANTDGWGRSMWGQADWGDTNIDTVGWGANTWGFQSWGSFPTIELTGLTATTSLGIPDELIEVKPGWGTLNWGQNGWGSVESATETLTGLSLTSSLGTVTAEDVVGLTGFSLTSTLNSLSAVKADFTTTLTGLGLVSSEGLISLDDHSVGLPGQSATTTLGSISPADIMGLTGLSATSTIGSFTFTSDPVTELSALTVLATQLGNLTVEPATLIPTGSLTGTTALGTVTTTQLSNVFPDGQVATTSLNDDKLILKYYGKISPKDSGGYTTITPKNSTGYTAITS